MATIVERRTGDGKIRYQAKVRLKGFPPQTATFDRKTDARKWIQDTESAIRDGRHFKGTEAKRHTLSEMIERYMRDVLPSKSDSMQRDQTTQLNWWKERIGDRLLSDITPALIAEHRDLLLKEIGPKKKKRSPSSVINYMAALSHVFTIAIREWEWLEDSPIRNVRKPKRPRGRVRFLDKEEREQFLEVCKASHNSALYPVVVLALSTGARRMEIMNLTWGDIDFIRKRAIIHETKNDERRAIRLGEPVFKVIGEIQKVRRIDTNLLFPDETGRKPIDLRRAWDKAIKEVGIEDFRFHDLRHSAASYLAMEGASLAEISAALGHKTLQMVKRYSHLSEEHTGDVVARMNDTIFGSI
jgi:integrase